MSMRSALRGPAHQLAVRMRINNCTHGHNNINNYCPIANQPAMHHTPAAALVPRVCTLVPFIDICFPCIQRTIPAFIILCG